MTVVVDASWRRHTFCQSRWSTCCDAQRTPARSPTNIASLAHADLLDLRIELVSYDMVASLNWEFRRNVTAYDAWYVAVAELLDGPLATLDQRLVSSSGPTCRFRTPFE
jgi:predicted nucleic acid-binding protein